MGGEEQEIGWSENGRKGATVTLSGEESIWPPLSMSNESDVADTAETNGSGDRNPINIVSQLNYH